MWGNKQGWLISAVIVLAMSWMLYAVGRVDDVSRPTGKFRDTMNAPVAAPVDPLATVKGVMTEPCDSADSYRKAIDEYLKEPARPSTQ